MLEPIQQGDERMPLAGGQKTEASVQGFGMFFVGPVAQILPLASERNQLGAPVGAVTDASNQPHVRQRNDRTRQLALGTDQALAELGEPQAMGRVDQVDKAVLGRGETEFAEHKAIAIIQQDIHVVHQTVWMLPVS